MDNFKGRKVLAEREHKFRLNPSKINQIVTFSMHPIETDLSFLLAKAQNAIVI